MIIKIMKKYLLKSFDILNSRAMQKQNIAFKKAIEGVYFSNNHLISTTEG